MSLQLPRDTVGEDALMLQKAHTDKIHDALEGIHNMTVSPAGLGKLVSDGKSPAILQLDISAVATAASSDRPWGVKVQNFGTGASPLWKFFVYGISRLIDPDAGYTEVSVAGVGAWHAFALGGTVRIWLETAYDTTDATWGDLLSAAVKWDGSGTWGGGAFEYIDSGSGDSHNYVNSKARKIIAQISVGDDGSPVVDQWVSSHLSLNYTGGEANDSGGGSPQSTALRGIFPLG